MTQGTQTGALWQAEGWDGEWNGREVQKEGTWVYLWLILVGIWHKTTKFCKVIILQFKIFKKNRKWGEMSEEKILKVMIFMNFVLFKIYIGVLWFIVLWFHSQRSIQIITPQLLGKSPSNFRLCIQLCLPSFFFLLSFTDLQHISCFLLNFSTWLKWFFPNHVLLLPYTQSLEKAMAPHSSTLAWKIPWMEQPGRLQSVGSQRVGHDWATSLSLFTFVHWRRKWQPTPVFLPGESQGRQSLVGCHLWGRTESDMTESS